MRALGRFVSFFICAAMSEWIQSSLKAVTSNPVIKSKSAKVVLFAASAVAAFVTARKITRKMRHHNSRIQNALDTVADAKAAVDRKVRLVVASLSVRDVRWFYRQVDPTQLARAKGVLEENPKSAWLCKKLMHEDSHLENALGIGLGTACTVMPLVLFPQVLHGSARVCSQVLFPFGQLTTLGGVLCYGGLGGLGAELAYKNATDSWALAHREEADASEMQPL